MVFSKEAFTPHCGSCGVRKAEGRCGLLDSVREKSVKVAEPGVWD